MVVEAAIACLETVSEGGGPPPFVRCASQPRAERGAIVELRCVVMEPALRLGRHYAARTFEWDLDQHRGAVAGGAGDLQSAA